MDNNGNDLSSEFSRQVLKQYYELIVLARANWGRETGDWFIWLYKLKKKKVYQKQNEHDKLLIDFFLEIGTIIENKYTYVKKSWLNLKNIYKKWARSAGTIIRIT